MVTERPRACYRRIKLVRGLLVAAQRREELLHVRWRGFERRKLAREVVDRLRTLIAARLIPGQRVAERTPAAPPIVERRRQCLCVKVGVADALRGDRILVVTGIPDERPTRTKWLTEVVADACRADPFFFARRALQSVRDARRRLEHFFDVALDVSAHLFEPGTGPQHRDERQTVVCREAAHGLVVTNVLLEIVGGESAEVAVVVRRQRRLHVVLGRSYGFGHQRVRPVSADHDSRPLVDRAARPAVALDAGDAITVPQ